MLFHVRYLDGSVLISSDCSLQYKVKYVVIAFAVDRLQGCEYCTHMFLGRVHAERSNIDVFADILKFVVEKVTDDNKKDGYK